MVLQTQFFSGSGKVVDQKKKSEFDWLLIKWLQGFLFSLSQFKRQKLIKISTRLSNCGQPKGLSCLPIPAPLYLFNFLSRVVINL